MSIDYSKLPLPKGEPNAARKIRRDRAHQSGVEHCYRLVDARDGGRCQCPGCHSLRKHHHHLVYRSQGGRHETQNVVSLCEKHHGWIHGGLVTVEGNADVSLTWALTRYGQELKLPLPASHKGR